MNPGQVKFDNKALQQKLNSMDQRARTAAYKNAVRKASRPGAEALQRAWAAAKRRTGLVTGDIADAQDVRITATKSGGVTAQIGTNYRRGGYAKLWHIIENGFKHFGGSGAYTTLGGSINKLKRQRQQFFKAARAEIKEKPAGKQAKRQMNSRIAAAWRERAPNADSEIGAAVAMKSNRTSKARKGKSKRIPGRFISRRVAEEIVDNLATDCRNALMAYINKGKG